MTGRDTMTRNATKNFRACYSAGTLVQPNTEELISELLVGQNFWRSLTCPKMARYIAWFSWKSPTTHFWCNWKQATIPTSSPGGSRQATELQSAQMMQLYLSGSARSDFPIFGKSYFCSTALQSTVLGIFFNPLNSILLFLCHSKIRLFPSPLHFSISVGTNTILHSHINMIALLLIIIHCHCHCHRRRHRHHFVLLRCEDDHCEKDASSIWINH